MNNPVNIIEKASQFGDLIFDLDNTLLDAEDYDRGAFSDISMAFPAGTDLTNYLLNRKREKGPLYQHLFNDAVAYYSLPITAIRQMVELYHQHDAHLVNLSPEYRNMLECLSAHGHRLFLVTNGNPKTQEKKIEKMAARHLFTDIVICDGIKQPLKPAPDAYLMLDKKYKLHDPIMIGDMPDIDGLFAEQSGIPFLLHCFRED